METEAQIDFVNNNLSQIPIFLNSIKEILNDFTLPVQSPEVYIMIGIIKEILGKEEKIDFYFRESEDNKEQVEQMKGIVINFINEEREILVSYFEEVAKKKNEGSLRLKNMEWKFIGLTTAEEFDKGVIEPKILVRLEFNDGSYKIFESDFATLKKLQEEIEDCTSGFNSTYTRRIEHFAK